MTAITIVAILIGNLTVTAYEPVKEQTDSTPFNTSTGDRVRAGGVAVSRDLLCGACRKLHHRCKRPDNPTKLHYGDWLYVDGYGFRQVNDLMGAYTTQRVNGKKVRIPIKQHIDIFVWTWKEEHAVQVKTRAVYKIKGEPICTSQTTKYSQRLESWILMLLEKWNRPCPAPTTSAENSKLLAPASTGHTK